MRAIHLDRGQRVRVRSVTKREGYSWMRELVGKESEVKEVRENGPGGTRGYRVGPFAWDHGGGPEHIDVWFAAGQLEAINETKEEVA